MPTPDLLNKTWRLSHLYKIINKQKERIQFVPNYAQAHFRQNAHTRNVILKSRQLGFTTLEAIDMTDDSLFIRNQDGLIIAHNLDAAATIFDKKIGFAWHNLDDDLKSLYRVDANNARTLKFDFGDGTFSSIAVDTSGRSGTYSRVHVTEFAIIAKERPDKAEEILSGTIPAVPEKGRIDIESSPAGSSGLFYDMFNIAWRRGAPKSPMEFKAHFYNWTWEVEAITAVKPMAVPDEFEEIQKRFKLTAKQITFYYLKWLSLNKDWQMMHKEYPTTPKEAFEAVLKGVYYADDINRAYEDGRIKRVPYETNLPVHTVWDLGYSAIGFYQRIKGETRMIDYFESPTASLKDCVKELKRKPYIYGKHFAPHDIRVKEFSTGVTRIETAANLGIEFEMTPNVSIMDGINAGHILFDHLWVDATKCKMWVDHISEYRRQWNERLATYTDEPVHDNHSHGADVHRYAALVEKEMTNEPIKQGVFYDKTRDYWRGQ